jgi:hypothetical protein
MTVRERTLRLDEILLDFQSTDFLIEETVYEYMTKMQRGVAIDPVIVRFDGSRYFCQDGFHRIEAAKRIGRKRIKAQISPGTLAEMEAEFQEKVMPEVKKTLQAWARGLRSKPTK